MEIRQLEYFIELAKIGNLSKAAEEINISQTALSKSLNMLESELNHKLFDRTGKKMLLNEYGRGFLQYAQKTISLINESYAAMHKDRFEMTGDIKIRSTVSYGEISAPILTYQELNPRVRIELKRFNREKEDSENAVFLFATDLDNLELPNEGKGWERERVGSGEMGLVFRDDCPWYIDKNQKSVWLKDFAGAAFVSPGRFSFSSKNLMLLLCQNAGFFPLISCESDVFMFRMQMVNNNFGVTFCSSEHQREVAFAFPELKYHPLNDPNARFNIYLLHPRRSLLSETCQDFLDFYLNY